MRDITHHRDGHDLAKDITIKADDLDLARGAASHEYEISNGGMLVGQLQYQRGGRNEPGSTAGVTDQALLAVVLDRLQCFQAGPFPCRENAVIITKIQECLFWYRERADQRAARGVLGKNTK